MRPNAVRALLLSSLLSAHAFADTSTPPSKKGGKGSPDSDKGSKQPDASKKWPCGPCGQGYIGARSQQFLNTVTELSRSAKKGTSA
jgi:hypothetical protein